MIRATGPVASQPTVTDHLTGAWARGYERGNALAEPRARAVVEGGGARFATLHVDDEVAAIARWTIDGPWVGIAPVEVGAARAWLQVTTDNEPALALYDRLGFRLHHRYWYHQPPDDGGDT